MFFSQFCPKMSLLTIELGRESSNRTKNTIPPYKQSESKTFYLHTQTDRTKMAFYLKSESSWSILSIHFSHLLSSLRITIQTCLLGIKHFVVISYMFIKHMYILYIHFLQETRGANRLESATSIKYAKIR